MSTPGFSSPESIQPPFVRASCRPTTPTRTSPTPGSAPEPAFTLTMDRLGSQDALTGVSETTVDAGASTESGLRYLVDFGDGTVVRGRAEEALRTEVMLTLR